ncbi:paired box protein Pax-1-like [Ptychodera flava]|uniref:paired box protein Pax-1-like n=1 Tax=Ptychodera flava TaxID=63121 RepID=UPI00396A6E0D
MQRGFPTPFLTRRRILELHLKGVSYGEIASTTGVSKSTAHSICCKYERTGSLTARDRPARERTKVVDNVLQHIEFYKRRQPSIYLREIRRKLLDDNVCTAENVPSLATIHRAITEYLNMSRKKISSLAAESMTPSIEQYTLDFIETVSDYNINQIHWFDESSVIRTTGNRRFGHSEIGTPAVEIQRHASNATYTVNLLVSATGVDHSDVIVGPSNGLELLNFFDEAVRVTDNFGNPCLAVGDCVIMDNCGFHHARYVEQNLQRLLQARGVRLIYQPPYNPQFNACEPCFNYIKSELRSNQDFAYRFTELATANAIANITPGACRFFARECGYI